MSNALNTRGVSSYVIISGVSSYVIISGVSSYVIISGVSNYGCFYFHCQACALEREPLKCLGNRYNNEEPLHFAILSLSDTVPDINCCPEGGSAEYQWTPHRYPNVV